MITVHQKPDAGFSTRPNPASILFPKVWFTDLSVGAVSWFWNFGDGTTSGLQNPVHVYNGISDNEVWQIVSTEFSCLDTAIQTVIIDAEFTLYIPNAFTPDDDRKNETFTASGIGFTEFSLDIYSRWGQHLYHTKNIEKGWNGQVDNQGVDLKMGVYIYHIEVLDYSNQSHRYTGKVTLLR